MGLNFLGGVRVSVRGLRGVRVAALGITKVLEIRSRGGGAQLEILGRGP